MPVSKLDLRMPAGLFIPKLASLPGVCWKNAISEIQSGWKNFAPPLEAYFYHQLIVEHPLQIVDTVPNGGMSPEWTYREGGPWKSISKFSMVICISKPRFGLNIDLYLESSILP